MKKSWLIGLLAATLIGAGIIGVIMLKGQGLDVVATGGQKDVAIMASGVYRPAKPDSSVTLDPKLVRIIREEEDGDLKEAKAKVVEDTLNALNFSEWLEHTSLNSYVISGDIYPDPGEELIVASSVGKDQGVVAIYSSGENGYQMAGSLAELVPITRIALIRLPGLNTKAILIDEYLDEMSGAFFRIKTKSVYIYQDKGLKKIWERDRLRKEYYPEGEELQGDQTRWMLQMEEAAIVFSPDGNITVTGIQTHGRSKNLNELDGEYEIITRTKFEEFYVWDAPNLAFRLENR